MKIGDLVKIKHSLLVYKIIYKHTLDNGEVLYTIAANVNDAIYRHWLTEAQMELTPNTKDVLNKLSELVDEYCVYGLAEAMGRMLLKKMSADEVMDILNNIDEYMK